MRNFLNFIQYHNAVPIGLGILFLGGGAAFAATDPQAIYSQSQKVVAIDNTYIAAKDLSSYTPRAEITGVTEDTDNYYVTYRLSTIDLVDSVWKDTVKDLSMAVSKPDLGPYRDLGVYVTQQLRQNVERELQRLRDTQEIEKKQISQKVVATLYGGLVGKLLDSSTETLPGYTPVVVAPEPAQVAAAGAASGSSPASSGASGAAISGQSSGNPSLRLQMLGNNPAQILLGHTYSDLGGVATDSYNSNLRIETYLDGARVEQVQIDTATTSRHVVKYIALDPSSNSVFIERVVYVYDPAIGKPVPDSEVKSNESTPFTEVQVPAAPTPTPEPTPTTTPSISPEPAATSTAPVETPPTDTATTTTGTTPIDPPPASDTATGTSTTETPPAETVAPPTEASTSTTP